MNLLNGIRIILSGKFNVLKIINKEKNGKHIG